MSTTDVCFVCGKRAAAQCGKCPIAYCGEKCADIHFANGHKTACIGGANYYRPSRRKSRSPTRRNSRSPPISRRKSRSPKGRRNSRSPDRKYETPKQELLEAKVRGGGGGGGMSRRSPRRRRASTRSSSSDDDDSY